MVFLENSIAFMLVPPAYIAETTAIDSRNPITIKGDLGRDSISSVVMPAWYLT